MAEYYLNNIDPDPFPPSVYPPNLRKRPSIYREGFVYLMRRASDSAIKIGLSANPNTRLNGVKADLKGDSIELISFARVRSMRRAEVILHRRYSHYRVRPDCEWFRLPVDDLDALISEFSGVC